ncbi:MAG: S8 family serine peptidase [Gammaproteobacteria bacterium]
MLKLLPLIFAFLSGLAFASERPLSAESADGYRPLVESLDTEPKVYIVQLDEPPALGYRGGKPGMAKTRPRRGQRFDAADPRVRRYGSYLTTKHDSALRSVGAYQTKLYSYRYAFNGFAARMTPLQAEKLRGQRGVAKVWEDRIRYLNTNDSSRFLGLLNGQDGLRIGEGLTGEDVVIAVIDSGITPEHPSFKDSRSAKKPKICRSSFGENTLVGIWLCTKYRRKEDRLVYDAPVGWTGACEAGDEDIDRFTTRDCNNKLIGARFYIDGFLERNFLDINEFISPRDADGHGTHIASTAAGNEVRAKIAGQKIDEIIGIAPRARIAVYKACWLEPGQTRGSCSTADLQRAIEDAVADGVDIINYSVGSSDISISDPDDLALLAASDAGILSVVAAGNDGPTPESILSPAAAPWVLSVGNASRTGTRFERALQVDSPSDLAGDYVIREGVFTRTLESTGTIEGELVLVDDGVVSVSDDEVGTTFDACQTIENRNEVEGKIALVQRGSCDFEVKFENAENAGATAVVVFNNTGGLLNMLVSPNTIGIPAVLISQSDGQLLLDELNRDEVIELQLLPDLVIENNAVGNRVADSSARGPNAAALDILKPDLVAPGVDILAGQTPDVANGFRGELYQYLTGTSMSVPHMAGLAALLKEARPDWSPAALRSALMTTARQNVLLNDGETPAGPFDMGAGYVDPNLALNPGLIYEAGKDDYSAFNCGAGIPRSTQAECDALVSAGYSLDPSNLNLPSIAIAELALSKAVTRRVTNTGDAPATFDVAVESPEGIDISVSPTSLTLAPGESAPYTASFSNVSSALNQWVSGALTWSDGTRQVRSPVVVKPVNFSAVETVLGDTSDDTRSFDVEFGYTGNYRALATGLELAERDGCRDTNGFAVPCLLAEDFSDNYQFEPVDADLPDSVERFDFNTIEDTVFLRVALFDEDTAGQDDLDLYLYYSPDGQFYSQIARSVNNDSNEVIDLPFPAAGEYFVDVHGYDTQGQNGTEFILSVWRLGSEETPTPANLTVTAPTSAAAGTVSPVNIQWQGLNPGRYLGGIEHRDDTDAILTPFTRIDVEVPAASP